MARKVSRAAERSWGVRAQVRPKRCQAKSVNARKRWNGEVGGAGGGGVRSDVTRWGKRLRLTTSSQ